MPEKSIIQQLKDNRYAFGMWPDPECYGKKFGEAMQGKARALPKEVFDVYENFPDGVDWNPCLKGSGNFCTYQTYRLHADYEDEPEIVECEIKRQFNDVYYIFTGKCPIYTATGDPDFIGLKFENWIWGMAYKNKHTGIITLMIRADQLDDYEVCDMTQAHVLFRRTKQE